MGRGSAEAEPSREAPTTSDLPPCEERFLLDASSSRTGNMQRRLTLKSPVRWRRRLVSFVLSGCGILSTHAAPELQVGMTVQLPPFIVEQTIGPTWRYGQIPRFEILSRCDDATTARLILAFHQANQLLGMILPPRFQVAMDVPQTLILYDEKLWPVAEQRAVAALLRVNPPAHGEDPPPAKVPPRVKLVPVVGAEHLGLDSPRPSEQGSFFSNLMLADADSITTFVLVSSAIVDPQDSSLTPAYVGSLLSSRAPALPGWFTAGFLRLYGQMVIRHNTVLLKTSQWEPRPAKAAATAVGPAQKPDLDPIASLAQANDNNTVMLHETTPWKPKPAKTAKTAGPEIELLPLPAFFDARAPQSDMDPAAWQAQAELFITWGLDPEGGRTEAFWKFVDRACSEPVTEPMFRECLGLGFDEATRQLSAYALKPHSLRWTLPDDLARPPSYALEDASRREIARLKGEWERLETRYVRKYHPDLETDYLALARRTLHKAYDRDDRDPRLLASLGLLELDAGNRPAARELLEESARLGVVRPRVYFELARLRYDYSFGRSPRNDGKLTAEQTSSILEPLLIATRQAPPLPQVYELMAHVCANSAVPPSDEILTALEQGAGFFPKNGDLLVKVAALYSDTGASVRALHLVQIGLQHASKESVREQLLELNRKLGETAGAKR